MYFNCCRTTRSEFICRCTYTHRSTTWGKNPRSRMYKRIFLLEQLGSFFPCWKIPSIINTQLFSLLHVKNLELKTNHIFNLSLYVTCSFTTLRFNGISLVSGTLCSFNKSFVITVGLDSIYRNNAILQTAEIY